jgi:hypothetical protein
VEFVMRYLFWVVLLVIVALAGGFYFLAVPGLQAETETLLGDINRQASVLDQYAKNKSDIKTMSHVEATKAYYAKLAAQDKAVKDLLKGKTLAEDPRFQKAPADALRFDEWLIGARKEILAEAEKAGLILPSNFAVQWLDQDKITVKGDRDARLEKVAFVAEVIRLLCEVKGTVTVTEFAKADQPETTKQATVGVCSLDGIDRLDAVKAEARERDYLTQAFASGAKAQPPLKKLPPRPYRSEMLDLRFTAPMSLVPQVVQAFETSPRWFAIVRKLDCQRVAEPYAKVAVPATSKAVEVGADGRPIFSNNHYQEAPVQVQFWLEILKMDEQKLK